MSFTLKSHCGAHVRKTHKCETSRNLRILNKQFSRVFLMWSLGDLITWRASREPNVNISIEHYSHEWAQHIPTQCVLISWVSAIKKSWKLSPKKVLIVKTRLRSSHWSVRVFFFFFFKVKLKALFKAKLKLPPFLAVALALNKDRKEN